MKSDSTSARGGAARGGPIKLRDAPAFLFADDFARLAALKGGEAEALDALDRPDPGILAFYRREALAFGALSFEQREAAQAQEDADLLARTLVARIRDSAAAGLLAAAGLFARTGLRQEIPPELWAEVKIEFAAGRLTLGEFAYAAVTVREAAADEPAPPAAEDDPAGPSAPSSTTAGAGGRRSRRRSAKPPAKGSGRRSPSAASTPPRRPSTAASAGGPRKRQTLDRRPEGGIGRFRLP